MPLARNLILVRHSLPLKIESLPSKNWILSEEGRKRAQFLATKLVNYQPAIIATSTEPKAVETAEIIAKKFNKPLKFVPELNEHDRSNSTFMEEQKFVETLANFFNSVDKLVMGLETATQAHQRFQQAVENIIGQAPDGDVIVVSHGTVITLFIAGITGIEPFQFWQQLELPMAIVLPLADVKKLEIITVSDN